MMKIAEVAKKLGVCQGTLRIWDNTDKLKPTLVTPGGHRFYDEADVDRQVAAFDSVKVKLLKFTTEQLKAEIQRRGGE